MQKEASLEQAMSHIKSGMTIMMNGFMGVKTPNTIIDKMVEEGIKDITLIANDSAIPNESLGKLVHNKMVKKLMASHIGLNPEAGEQMTNGEMEVDLIPQGTLAERIRSAGAGIGGFFTPTGVGTEVAEGKESRKIDGKEYILEMPLRADVAVIKASVADRHGNAFYRATSKNFSIVMATAADYVIVEADLIVDELNPEQVMTQGIFVDCVVQGDKKYSTSEAKLKESAHV